MAISAASLAAKIKAELPADVVEIEDVSGGCGSSFEVVIVSSAFEGKPTLARHRLVNALLAEELKVIHAFTQKTLTPEQYATQKQ